MPKGGMMKSRGPSAKGSTYMYYGHGAKPAPGKNAPLPPGGQSRVVRSGGVKRSS